MAPILIAGTLIVNLALIFYTIGIVTEQRRRQVTSKVLWFLTLGVVFDVTATICMIAGSSQGAFTLHGFLGYSSLIAMLVETALAWRHRLHHGDGQVPTRAHLYARIAYIWWVLAYITGAVLVFAMR